MSVIFTITLNSTNRMFEIVKIEVVGCCRVSPEVSKPPDGIFCFTNREERAFGTFNLQSVYCKKEFVNVLNSLQENKSVSFCTEYRVNLLNIEILQSDICSLLSFFETNSPLVTPHLPWCAPRIRRGTFKTRVVRHSLVIGLQNLFQLATSQRTFLKVVVICESSDKISFIRYEKFHCMIAWLCHPKNYFFVIQMLIFPIFSA